MDAFGRLVGGKLSAGHGACALCVCQVVIRCLTEGGNYHTYCFRVVHCSYEPEYRQSRFIEREKGIVEVGYG